MKKLLILFLSMAILTGCVTTPETVSIESTVEAAVKTAVAPYEARLNEISSKEYVTSGELETSQNEQMKQVQNLIMDQFEYYKANIFPVETASPVQQGTSDSTIEFKNGQIVPTPTSRVYKNEATCVDRFEFIGDITIPDGQVITPYTSFTKTWSIKNVGDCTWNSKYKLVYNSGDEVYQKKEFSILQPGYFIQPGESLAVSADLTAPNSINQTFITYWAMESDRGEVFGAGDAKNVYLTSNFTVRNYFAVYENFGSLVCYDDEGQIPCGVSNTKSGRGVVYYDSLPMLESHRGGNPAIAVCPPIGRDNSIVRFEFGPLRFPRMTNFYTNFCCHPDTPHCDVLVRLYTKEAGYDWMLRAEEREWNDGFLGEWKFTLDDLGIFDQEFMYAIEVESIGGATDEDLILFSNFRIY